MGLDVASVNFTYLPRPSGYAYEFAKKLNEYSSCCGEGNSFCFYYKDELHEEADSHCENNNLTEEAKTEIVEWINSLPWEGDEIVLNFWW